MENNQWVEVIPVYYFTRLLFKLLTRKDGIFPIDYQCFYNKIKPFFFLVNGIAYVHIYNIEKASKKMSLSPEDHKLIRDICQAYKIFVFDEKRGVIPEDTFFDHVSRCPDPSR